MQFPDEIKTAAESYALTFDHKTLAAAAASLSARYREEKGSGSVLAASPADIAAYAVTRMPATFAAVSTALEHTLRRTECTIRTAADIGAGTGAAAWAASILTDGLEDISCFEREPEMRRIGEMLMREAQIAVTAVWHDLDITRGSLPRHYDLITACYMLGELTEKDRERALLTLWEHSDKLLLITEPGTPKGYANILHFRKLLTDRGAGIAFPCPDIGECPLPDGDWCHFTARAARSKLHKQLKGGDVPYEDEKFCCIAAVRGSFTPCEARILRRPQTASGFVTLHVCTSGGVSDMKITKSSKLFKNARKADCGDSFTLDKNVGK